MIGETVINSNSGSETVPAKKVTKAGNGIIQRLKDFFKKLAKIKNIELYLALIIAAIIILVYFSGFFKSDTTDKPDTNTETAFDYCLRTEQKLQSVLSQIKGAGKVDVMINFESTPEIIVAYITTSTSGGAGSTSNSQSNTSSPQILTQQGSQLPLILKTVYPAVKGVIVVAEGADNAKVRLEIMSAVSTVLQISQSNISVNTMKK